MVTTGHKITLAALVAVLSIGCGGGGGSDRGSSTAPITSGGLPNIPGGGNGGPPLSNLLTDALVSSWQLREVIHVDAKAGTITNRWSTGEGPTDVVNGITETFVTNAVSQDVTVVDRLAGNVASTIDVTSVPVTGLSLLGFVDPILKPLVRPTGIAVTPNGNKAYSANLLNVTAIDARTHQPIKSILGLSQIDLAQLISDPANTLTNFLASPVQGLGMAKVAATDQYALATSMLTGKVMRIDALTDRVVDYTPVGRGPIGITIAGGKAFVACALSQEVYVIDVATGQVRATLQAGMIPVDCAASPSEDKVYVANAISGDISVIDVAANIVVDTLPAGLSITTIFQQLGITVPSGTTQGGISSLLNGFLQGYASGLNSPTSFGNLIAGGTSGGLLSPGALINGLITAFLGYAGISQQALGGMNLPGIGILSVSVAHDPNLVCAANAFLGELAVTEASTRTVSSFAGLTGLGPADVATIWKR